MGESNSSREEEQRILAMFEQAALNDYPNPDRVGCPGSSFLKKLARNRRSIPITHPDLTHVARCSPCFREFSEYRRGAAQRSSILRRAIASLVLVVGVASAALLWQRPIASWIATRTTGEYETASLDMKNLSTTRGLDRGGNAPEPAPLHLRRKRLALRITLPFASQPGQYEVRISRAGGEALVFAAGNAQIEGGLTILPIKIDLTQLSAGQYDIGVRRVPLDWFDNTIQID